jgi:aminopeptidase C
MKKLIPILLIVCLCSLSPLNRIQAQGQEGYTFTTVKELPITLIQNQNRTSTCWCFATLSFLESELIRMGKGNYNLSEMYVVWHTWLSKADKYVRTDGNIHFAPGGGFEDVFYVMKNWGFVPEEVMTGLHYGEELHVHNEMDAVLKGYIDPLLQNPNRKLSTAWKRGVEGILNAYLGNRPQKFNYQGKEYTPTSFAASLNINPDDYVPLTSFSHHPFYTQFALEVPDNWIWANYHNLPLNEFISIFDHAINNGYTVLWASDVSESGYSRNGTCIVPGADHPQMITQEIRQIAFDNKQTTDDHAMHIFGIATDQNGKKFYMVKNSYGETTGYKGIWYATEAYVAKNTTAIMVHKNAIPAAIKQKLNIK